MMHRYKRKVMSLNCTILVHILDAFVALWQQVSAHTQFTFHALVLFYFLLKNCFLTIRIIFVTFRD